jgi:hypothetical protein
LPSRLGSPSRLGTPAAVFEPSTGDDIQATIYIRDLPIIKQFERYFIVGYNQFAKSQNIEEIKLGETSTEVCCTDSERKNIIMYGNLLKDFPKYNKLRLVEIYMVLIFVHYALKYNDQLADWLIIKYLRILINRVNDDGSLLPQEMSNRNFKLARQLYWDIGLRNYIPKIFAGERRNLLSEIRRTILGFNTAGGKKHKTIRRKRK